MMLTRDEIQQIRFNAAHCVATTPQRTVELCVMALALLDCDELEPSTAQSPEQIVEAVRIGRCDYDRYVAIQELVALDDDEDPEPGECSKCHQSMQTDEGCEPTSICHHCAQDIVMKVRAIFTPEQ